MSLLTTLGTEMPLDALSAELKRRIEARGLGPPRSFVKWAEQILVDHPERKALVLPAGTRIEGDAKLDGDDLLERGIATVAVLGDLEISGRLTNADSEGGPFLFVDGDLRAGEILKGGSSIIVLGSVTSRGLLICDSSIGAFLAAVDLSASAIILCDQDLHAGGTINGEIISEELGNMRARLVPEVFSDPADLNDEFADGDLIRERLDAGLPILKG